jgi:transcriptional regulator with XRE-family HTH domain
MVFTDRKMQIHAPWNSLPGMAITETAFQEALCDRFVLAWEATGLLKKDFAARVGITSQQFTNISRYRNPPSHDVIRRAVNEWGFTTDWFYFGSRIGFREPKLAERLRELESRPVARG